MPIYVGTIPDESPFPPLPTGPDTLESNPDLLTGPAGRLNPRRSRFRARPTVHTMKRLAPTLLAALALATAAGASDETVLHELGGELYAVQSGRVFRVLPDRFSLRLVPDAPESFLADSFPLLRILRRNRLGIHDVLIPAGTDVREWVRSLAADPRIEFAEHHFRGQYNGVPNDPQFGGTQWHLNNTGQLGGQVDADIDAVEAWDLETGDPSVVIAVLDSGTEVTHSDLAANIWHNAGEISGNGVDDDGNGFIDDLDGWDFDNNNADVTSAVFHGTFVAGVVGARTNNGVGIAGVAGGFDPDDGCRVMALGVGEFSPISGVLDDAVLYAVDNGARVITFSLGVPSSMALDLAIDDAVLNHGVFVDCSAGNGGQGVSYPATHPLVISVAGTTDQDTSWAGSLSGPENWVAAPAVDIRSTTTGNSYTTSSGTSFASPQVAGLAGLLLSAVAGLTPAEIASILRDTADDIGPAGFDNESGWGRINAHAAVQHVLANDCNNNGLYDPSEIASGALLDANMNGVPDLCECAATNYCQSAANSTGNSCVMSFSGSLSIAQNDFDLIALNAVPGEPGLFYYGRNQALLPFGDGFRCIAAPSFRLFPFPVTSILGDATYDFDFTSGPPSAGAGLIAPGALWNFQFWYRDPAAGATGFNLSDGLAATFCP